MEGLGGVPIRGEGHRVYRGQKLSPEEAFAGAEASHAGSMATETGGVWKV